VKRYAFIDVNNDILKNGEGNWIWFMELNNLKYRIKKDEDLALEENGE